MRQSFERLLVGKTLAGRYDLEEVIGAGGMSVVYRGTDRVLGRPVAVKVVSLPADSEEMRANLRERFRREAGSAARIAHHPNVVQVYDYGTDAELGFDFIVMELLRGRDLKQALARGAVEPREALRILRETARGLAAGHQEGIVHRDVKPANVFLVGDGGRLDYVRLLDFGIAKPLEPDEDSLTLTHAGQLPHSPAYASPEQLDPAAPVTAASDVFQLGLIGYELLTGERPYDEAERARVRAGEPLPPRASPRWAAVPAPVRAVIERALHPDPAERYPDAGVFADALARAEHAAEGDDHTMIIAPPRDDDDTRTVAAAPIVIAADRGPAPAVGRAAPPPQTPVLDAEPVSSEPMQLPSPAAATRRFSPAVWGIPLVLLVLALAVWAARNRRGAAPDPTVATDTGAVAALHDKFLRLEARASAALGTPKAEVSAPPAADTQAIAPVPPPAPDSAALRQAAAATVQQAVLDLHAAWSAGDLDRMMSHYAGRVDYYNADNASRSFVRGRIRQTIRDYPVRRITINRQASVMEAPDRMRVLVDKAWDFSGKGKTWTGSMRQELVFRLEDGAWRVVSEKSLEIYDDHKS